MTTTERETIMPVEPDEHMQHIRSDVDWSLRKAHASDPLRKAAQDVVTAADKLRADAGGMSRKQGLDVADALGHAIERVVNR